MSKNQIQQKQTEHNEAQNANILAGYVRMSNAGSAIKLSLSKSALEECSTYTSADGQEFIPLVIRLYALQSVIAGERVVTTVSQLHD